MIVPLAETVRNEKRFLKKITKQKKDKRRKKQSERLLIIFPRHPFSNTPDYLVLQRTNPTCAALSMTSDLYVLYNVLLCHRSLLLGRYIPVGEHFFARNSRRRRVATGPSFRGERAQNGVYRIKLYRRRR